MRQPFGQCGYDRSAPVRPEPRRGGGAINRLVDWPMALLANKKAPADVGGGPVRSELSMWQLLGAVNL